MDGYMRLTEISKGDEMKDAYLYVPSTLDLLDDFVTFQPPDVRRPDII